MTGKPSLTEYPILEDVDDATVIDLEDHLWWIVGRKALLRRLLDKAVAIRPVQRILEIGCGSGNNFDLLAQYGRVIACDSSPVQARRANSRKIAEVFVTQDCFTHEFSEPFELTCLFDVLEHVDDDVGLVRRLNRFVEPGHLVLASVPACPSLYGSHDRILEHFRRYKLTGLENLMRSQGFRVIHSTHFVTLLFPFVALSRWIANLRERIKGPNEEVNVGVVPSWLNGILTAILRFEAPFAANMRLPIGVWAVVLAEKVGEPQDEQA